MYQGAGNVHTIHTKLGLSDYLSTRAELVCFLSGQKRAIVGSMTFGRLIMIALHCSMIVAQGALGHKLIDYSCCTLFVYWDLGN